MINNDDIKKYGVSLPARIINWDDFSPKYSPLSGMGDITVGSRIPATLQYQYQGLLTDIEKYIGPVGSDPRDYRVGFMAERYRAAAVTTFINIRRNLRDIYEGVREGQRPVSQLETQIVSSRTALYREIKTTEADIRDQEGAMGDRARAEQHAETQAESIRRAEAARKAGLLVAPIEKVEGAARAAGAGILATLKMSKWLLPVAAVAAVAVLGARFMPKRRT